MMIDYIYSDWTPLELNALLFSKRIVDLMGWPDRPNAIQQYETIHYQIWATRPVATEGISPGPVWFAAPKACCITHKDKIILSDKGNLPEGWAHWKPEEKASSTGGEITRWVLPPIDAQRAILHELLDIIFEDSLESKETNPQQSIEKRLNILDL